MGADMISQRLTAILLALPLLILLFVSVPYWSTYGKQEKSDSEKKYIGYKKLFLAFMAIGYFGIWIFWIGGTVFLFLERYYDFFNLLTLPFLMTSFVQIIGLVILYIGSLFFAWAIGFARKSLRPSLSGIHADHSLIQDGPLGVVRHPYYVSYVLILFGLGLTLASLLPLFLALILVIGMIPTAEAEEKQLAGLFGEEYQQYQRRVGRFFPRLFGKRNRDND
jgi:protein-S-isoprenylcysteine O-methyltransferase Ste14